MVVRHKGRDAREFNYSANYEETHILDDFGRWDRLVFIRIGEDSSDVDPLTQYIDPLYLL